MRKRSTDRTGGAFNPLIIQAVWNKGKKIIGEDPNLFRFDCCGAKIYRWDYGADTLYGWEIDHIIPVSKNGSDFLDNLQPMQWQNNRSKSDHIPPYYSCAVTWRL